MRRGRRGGAPGRRCARARRSRPCRRRRSRASTIAVEVLVEHVVDDVADVGRQVDLRAGEVRPLADPGQAGREDLVSGRRQLAADVAEAVARRSTRRAPGRTWPWGNSYGSGPPASATTTPIAPATSSVAHDALPQDEQRDCGGSQHAELPGLAQGERQRDRGAEDRADRGRARAVEERARADGSRAGRPKRPPPSRMNEKDGAKATAAASSAAADPVRGVARPRRSSRRPGRA